MNETELYYTLALTQVEGIGNIMSKKLLMHFGNAEKIFQAKKSQLLAIENIGKITYEKLQNKTAFEKAERELKFISDNAIQTYFYLDSNYPERLKHCFDSPLLLFSSGEMQWQQQKIISIVGTRQITNYGSDFCKKLIEELAPLQPTIISGFAYGVDITAHIAAMDNGLQTIGVLAHGLDQIYPRSHSKYRKEIEKNGGLLTEFLSNSNPDRENFVKRNRIVAGMSEATIVIESAEKGGSLITAQIACDYNRDVFALPGRTTDKYSQGCNTLIKTQKAMMITSAADIIYNLNWDIPTSKKNKTIQRQLFISLSEEEQLLYNYLQKQGKQLLDVIALECNLPIFKTSSVLLNMELKGVIRPLPGKLFEAI
jgi:DNA processing protein